MKKRNGLMIGLLVVFSACHTAPKRLDNIAMIWKPTSEFKMPPGTSSKIVDTKIQFEPFKDVRKNPQLIAENREDAVPKPVTTRDNIGVFVSSNVRVAFDRLGLTTVAKDGDVVISGEVKQFFVEETNTYKGDVILHLNVRNRAGKTLWSGNASGVATNFGHSYSAENYYEVLSNSVLSAVSTLLQDPDFQAALEHKG